MNYEKIIIYTDGGCNSTQSKNVGAWAYIITKPKENDEEEKIYTDSNKVFETTNNKMELIALIEAFKKLDTEKVTSNTIVVKSDSMYLIKGMTQWVDGWKTNNWKTKLGGDVKNQDLWIKLDSYKTKYKPLFEWVKGHGLTKYNIECDAMCSKNIKEGIGELQNIK